MKLLDKIWPLETVHAHCDIPCGIYDPHQAQLAAHTIIRMLQLMEEATKAMGPNPTQEQRFKWVHDTHRWTQVKEQHAELVKHEVRIIWGDYFKAENATKDLHDLVWKIMKLASKCKQSYVMKDAEDLLDAVNEFAEAFWNSKKIATQRVKAPYPTGKDIVLPKI